jgi:hypothetical protein
LLDNALKRDVEDWTMATLRQLIAEHGWKVVVAWRRPHRPIQVHPRAPCGTMRQHAEAIAPMTAGGWMRVGYIGLGLMGKSIRNIRKAGFDMMFNRSHGPAEELARERPTLPPAMMAPRWSGDDFCPFAGR